MHIKKLRQLQKLIPKLQHAIEINESRKIIYINVENRLKHKLKQAELDLLDLAESNMLTNQRNFISAESQKLFKDGINLARNNYTMRKKVINIIMRVQK